MLIEKRLLSEGWKTTAKANFSHLAKPVNVKDNNVIVSYLPKYKVGVHMVICMVIIHCSE